MIYVQNLAGRKVWTFPKGHPDKGEKDKEAALREVREETGWDCQIRRTLLNVHYNYVHKGFFIQKTVRWFLMRPMEKVGKFDPEEIIRCRWFSLLQAKKRLTYKSDQELLKRGGAVVHSSHFSPSLQACSAVCLKCEL